MNRIFLIALGMVSVSAAFAQSVTMTNDATVQSGGPRSGTIGKTQIGAVGNGEGGYASFGVLEFTPTAVGNVSVSNLDLVLTQSNSPKDSATGFSVYMVPDVSTSIEPSKTSPITFNYSYVGGYGNQLGTPELLGTGNFKVPIPGAPTPNVYNILLNENTDALVSDLQGGDKFRLVITSATAKGFTTFVGVNTNHTPLTGTPKITFNTAPVPEPASFVVLGAGALALIRRRKTRLS